MFQTQGCAVLGRATNTFCSKLKFCFKQKFSKVRCFLKKNLLKGFPPKPPLLSGSWGSVPGPVLLFSYIVANFYNKRSILMLTSFTIVIKEQNALQFCSHPAPFWSQELFIF